MFSEIVNQTQKVGACFLVTSVSQNIVCSCLSLLYKLISLHFCVACMRIYIWTYKFTNLLIKYCSPIEAWSGFKKSLNFRQVSAVTDYTLYWLHNKNKAFPWLLWKHKLNGISLTALAGPCINLLLVPLRLLGARMHAKTAHI